MKLNELPKEIADSDNIGEVFAWRFMSFTIDEIPESTHKETIIKTINDRVDFLLCSEV